MYTQLMDLLDQLKAKSSFPILGSSQKKGQSRIDYFKFAVSPLRMLNVKTTVFVDFMTAPKAIYDTVYTIQSRRSQNRFLGVFIN